MQVYVPVVSSDDKPLMPTTNKRANSLIKRGKAIRRFNRGIFYIKMLVETKEYTQDIAVGIDPGSKKEAITVKSNSATYLNIQLDAVTWVKEVVKVRKIMRHNRRYHNTPYRKIRENRKRNEISIPPSTKARWQWKLRIVNILKKLYPIGYFVVEDVKVVTHKGKNNKWNQSFSPVQAGKDYFYFELNRIAPATTLRGYETYELRNEMGLEKSKDKMSDDFSAHCVDSWTIANYKVGGHVEPDNKAIIYLVPLRFHRRQLHAMVPTKGGKRRNYGGTMSIGFKRGEWIKHPKYGVCYVGGTGKGRISLHCLEDGKRLCQNAKPKDCQHLTFSSFRIKKVNAQ